MKIVIIEEESAEAGRFGVIVPERYLWPLQVLVARTGQKILSIKDEEEEVHDVLYAVSV